MRRGPRRGKQAKKKAKWPAVYFLKGPAEKFLPVAIPLLFFGFFFFFLTKAALLFLTRSPNFTVETVEASSLKHSFRFQDPSLLGSLLGRNIFQIDLSGLEDELLQKHPELLSAKVDREFPNRIRLKVIPREPVAQVQNGTPFLVDGEGVILPLSQNGSSRNLPLIVGLGEKIEKIQLGSRLRSKAMAQALAFLATLWELPELTRYIHTLDVSDEANLTFKTPEGLEVRLGQGDFKEKLKLFDRTRVSLAGRIGDVKYLDLRFEEVVIGSR